MKRRITTSIFEYTSVFFGLVAVFVLLMTLVFCIPQEWIDYHVEVAQDIYLYDDGFHSYFLFGTSAARFDNYDDDLMIGHTIPADPQMNPLEMAMSINGYSRYWHGYLVWLRPLLIFFNLWQIRYIYMLVFYMLLCAVLVALTHRIKGRAGIPAACAFMISLAACYPTVIATCMQYANVFIIMLLTCLILLVCYEKLISRLPLLFMVVGMVTSFVDFLTAPLITLGIPLLLCLFMDNHNTASFSLGSRAQRVFFCSLLWAVGYGACWAMKWVLGTIVLGENVFASAFEHFFNWTSDAGTGTRVTAFVRNIEFYFLAHGKKVYFVYIIPVALLLRRIIRRHNPQWKQGLVYLPVAVFPYLWYLVVNGHSLYHPFFAHRLQMITVLGACLCLIDMAVWKKPDNP